jgi:hypothetical protein
VWKTKLEEVCSMSHFRVHVLRILLRSFGSEYRQFTGEIVGFLSPKNKPQMVSSLAFSVPGND